MDAAALEALVEHVRALLVGDAAAGVLDGDPHLAVAPVAGDAHGAAGSAAAHRVADEVVEHPGELVGDADAPRRPGCDVDDQGDVLGDGRGRRVGEHVVQDRAQLDRLWRPGAVHGPSGARQLGEVVDHPTQPVDGGPDARGRRRRCP